GLPTPTSQRPPAAAGVSSAGAPAKPKRPSGDSLAAETADPGPPPTPPQRTSSHAGRNPPPARPPPPRLNGAGAAADKRPRPPLKINAVAKWTNPAGCDLVFVGANEGLYYMSLDQLHDPPWCCWCASAASGCSCTAASWHDLAQLFPADAKSKLKGRVAMRLANNPPSAKIPRTKGCMRVSAAKHPETAERWLACALPQSVLLLQWDNARRTFLEFKSLPCPDLPQPLLTFELLIRSGFKLPFVCVGVLRGRSDACVRFRLLDLNKLDGQIELSPNDETALDEEVEVTSVTQLDLNHVLVCYRNMARVFHMDTGLVRSRTGNRLGTLSFEFTIESVQCLDDSLLCFYKHGFQAKSFLGGEVVQDVEDRAHVYRFVGFAGQNPVMERRPADDPMASCDLMLIIGHVSA
uniref:CNH domain-containing protein n=1 Tax=Macrostomum lignano TaxID=282301 RepID=A0A1I8ITR5_9PLAT